jgi:DNA-binding NtrC family response regulator
MTAELLAQALDVLDQPLVICDRGGHIVYANRAAWGIFRERPASRRELDALAPAGVREIPVADGCVLILPARPAAASLAELERQAIEEVLAASGWHLAAAARRLGISRTTLWRRLKSYDLRRPAGGPSA